MLLEHADKAKGRIARIDSIKDAPICPNQRARRSRLRAADRMDQDGGKAARDRIATKCAASNAR